MSQKSMRQIQSVRKKNYRSNCENLLTLLLKKYRALFGLYQSRWDVRQSHMIQVFSTLKQKIFMTIKKPASLVTLQNKNFSS